MERSEHDDEPHRVEAARPVRSPVLVVRVGERLRNSLLVVPLLGMLGGWLLARLLAGRELNDSIRAELDSWYSSLTGSADTWIWFSAATFQTVTGTVAAAMLTFIGVVFSLTILALQVASSQLSPRIMRTFVRSNVVTATLAVFLATFVYSLTVLSAIQPGSDAVDAFEPFIAYYALLVLVGATLVMFTCYVSHVVRLIRVHHILDSVVDETRRSVVREAARSAERVRAVEPAPAPLLCTVPAAEGGVVCFVDVASLVGLARQRDVVLHLRFRIGDHLAAGQPLADVTGAPATGSDVGADEVRRHVLLGPERTVRGDPAFGLRQIVDVAIRALSPGVNDPTTAVQAVDRAVEVLFELGRRPDAPTSWVDQSDAVRVVQPAHSWAELLELSFGEVRRYGADSPQVTRRLSAALDDLRDGLDGERHEALDHQRALLAAAVGALAADDVAFRLSADRSGIG